MLFFFILLFFASLLPIITLMLFNVGELSRHVLLSLNKYKLNKLMQLVIKECNVDKMRKLSQCFIKGAAVVHIVQTLLLSIARASKGFVIS